MDNRIRQLLFVQLFTSMVIQNTADGSGEGASVSVGLEWPAHPPDPATDGPAIHTPGPLPTQKGLAAVATAPFIAKGAFVFGKSEFVIRATFSAVRESKSAIRETFSVVRESKQQTTTPTLK